MHWRNSPTGEGDLLQPDRRFGAAYLKVLNDELATAAPEQSHGNGVVRAP